MSTTTLSSATANPASDVKMPAITSMHHPAVRVFDAEETRRFYEDILGIPLAAGVIFDNDGIGNKINYMHSFHRLMDGNFLAFFDVPSRADPKIYASYNNLELCLGLGVAGEVEIEEMAERLSAAGVPFTGPVDNGVSKSIYFTDCNGVHLAIVANNPDYEEVLVKEKMRARNVLADWMTAVGSRKQ